MIQSLIILNNTVKIHLGIYLNNAVNMNGVSRSAWLFQEPPRTPAWTIEGRSR
jgi:hypothetical protein